MKRLETKYRVFRINSALGNTEQRQNVILENCSHIEFEMEEFAKEWILEHGDFRATSHDYTILPCTRVILEDEDTASQI